MSTWRVIQGDCLEVLKTLPPGSVDAVVTDPPYGIGYSSGHGSVQWGDGVIDGDENTEVRDLALLHVAELPTFCFGSWKRPTPKGVRACLVWDTLGALGMGDLRLPWKPAHQQIYVLGDPTKFSGTRGTDVVRCAPVQSMARNGRVHPLEKPVALMRWLINFLPERCTILDPFMGSGTTGVACMQTGRNFIGIEISEEYCEIARRRISEAANTLWTPEPRETQPEMFP